MQLRISIESSGARAEEVNAVLAHYVNQIEGASAYIRAPEHFITPMMPAPSIEAEGSPPNFSVFAYVDDREKMLVISFIALRIEPGSRGVTSCVCHDSQPILPDELRPMCREFVRSLADDQGGIRWLHKFNQAVRDLVD
jgi:hypothetical protein